ncbi:hypothetical protein J6590_064241 [Homalodisca vitripennis]|nr:hypothetical protein J6590_064241 [Homalodisca vitripennis]
MPPARQFIQLNRPLSSMTDRRQHSRHCGMRKSSRPDDATFAEPLKVLYSAVREVTDLWTMVVHPRHSTPSLCASEYATHLRVSLHDTAIVSLSQQSLGATRPAHTTQHCHLVPASPLHTYTSLNDTAIVSLSQQSLGATRPAHASQHCNRVPASPLHTYRTRRLCPSVNNRWERRGRPTPLNTITVCEREHYTTRFFSTRRLCPSVNNRWEQRARPTPLNTVTVCEREHYTTRFYAVNTIRRLRPSVNNH